MDASAVLAVISVVAAVFSALYARNAWTTARRAILYEALFDIYSEYSSAEMLDAVRTLWGLRRDHGEQFVDQYEQHRAKDDEKLSAEPPEHRTVFISNTLHYKRRMVSNFYVHLADLYLNKILPKDVLFSRWTREDLAIIPHILLPIEAKLGEAFGGGMTKGRMERLYEDAPKGVGSRLPTASTSPSKRMNPPAARG